MSEELESAPVSVTPVANKSVTSEQKNSENDDSLLPRISELLKLGGLAYAIGFAVIMVHTARLNAPVVEAFQFQNIIAGLPIWVPLCFALWLWPRLIRPVRGDATHPGISRNAIITLILVLCLGVLLLYQIVRWLAGRSFPVSETIVLISALLFAAVLSMLAAAYWDNRQRVGPGKAVLVLVCVYSGVLFLTLGYARFLYPRMPQSIGGGHPVQVRLYFKDHELTSLLGGSAAPGGSAASDPVYLYYRTSSYLLVSKADGQPLIQVPADEVLAIDCSNHDRNKLDLPLEKIGCPRARSAKS